MWFAALLVLLAGLVAVFGRLERPRSVPYVGWSGRTPAARQGAAVAGVALVACGVLGLAMAGLSEPMTRDASIVITRTTPLVCLAYLCAGAELLRRTARPHA